jgi:hypothetical protein
VVPKLLPAGGDAAGIDDDEYEPHVGVLLAPPFPVTARCDHNFEARPLAAVAEAPLRGMLPPVDDAPAELPGVGSMFVFGAPRVVRVLARAMCAALSTPLLRGRGQTTAFQSYLRLYSS